jgi:signal transduction histidine kinase
VISERGTKLSGMEERGAKLPKRLYKDTSRSAPDLYTFQRQESTFILLNLLLLGVILVLHFSLTSLWGPPSHALLWVMALGFALGAGEFAWVQTMKEPLSPRALQAFTWASIAANLALAVVLSELGDHEDSPFFVLMVVPVLQSAFRFPLAGLSAVVLSVDFLNFFWVWRYFLRHPPVDPAEYLEAGVFAITGFLVWILVSDLRQKEEHLARNLQELQRTREKLLQEETLAAVGRLSSAIAHEIRNPVAMIASSLATAERGAVSEVEREEMRQIAAREAERLERLTDDFLSYARTKKPQQVAHSLCDTLNYVASVCRAHAGEKNIEVRVSDCTNLHADIDSTQVHQALLNLVMNGIDASPAGGRVNLRAEQSGAEMIRIDIENQGTRIPDPARSRIFEPFFTTKARGTGLGLAIARNIARAHGGDLVLATNEPGRICFSMSLPATKGAA